MPPKNKKKTSSSKKSKSGKSKTPDNSGGRESVDETSTKPVRRSRRLSGEGPSHQPSAASSGSTNDAERDVILCSPCSPDAELISGMPDADVEAELLISGMPDVYTPGQVRRSRRIRDQGDGTTPPSPTPALATPNHTNTEQDLIGSPTIDESELIRNGIHPISRLKVMNCICLNPKECRAIMWRHAKIGNKKMFYVLLPGIPKVKETKTGKHVIGYRDRSFHHLYGVGNTDVDTRAPTTRRKKLYIAFHHYHEVYWQILRDSSKLSKKIYKWRVPVEVGRQCEPPLTNADKCKVPDTRTGYGDSFFAVPILSDLDSAYDIIANAEREYNLMLNVYDLNVGEPVLVTGRKTPKERRIDMKERDAKANPRATALRMQDLEDEIEMLRVEVKKLKEAADESDKTHQAELEMQNEIVTTQLMSTGLTRLSMLSSSYHNNKPWLSKYLFGRTWEQHLDLAKELFGITPTTIIIRVKSSRLNTHCFRNRFTFS